MDTEHLAPPPRSAPSGAGVVGAAQAEAFLVARFGGEVSRVSSIGHGEWSKAYAYRRAEVAYVIRFSALDEDFAKDRLAARYGSPDLPIPPITEIGTAFDGFYAISERACGGYLDDLDSGQLRQVLPRLFAALDAARLLDLSDSAGYGQWGADGKAPHASWRAALLDVASDRRASRTHGWRERMAASSTGCGPFDDAFRRLRTLAEVCPDERHLIHSDLLNYNVLVAGGRITAVIDWGCSMYGDFLYDLAWFAFWSPWYPGWQDVDFGREALRHYAAIGVELPRFAERLRCYQTHIGLGAQAYCAFKGRWADLDAAAKRTLEVAEGSR